MKKRIVFLMFFFLCWNQWGEGYNRHVNRVERLLDKPPIGSVGWYFYADETKQRTINVADEYFEHDAYAFINEYNPEFMHAAGGLGSTRYWLYDTYTHYKGDMSAFFDKYLPEWLRRAGYFIDIPITIYGDKNSSARNLDNSIKELMIRERSDLAITLLPVGSEKEQKILILLINLDKKNNIFTIYFGYAQGINN